MVKIRNYKRAADAHESILRETDELTILYNAVHLNDRLGFQLKSEMPTGPRDAAWCSRARKVVDDTYADIKTILAFRYPLFKPNPNNFIFDFSKKPV